MWAGDWRASIKTITFQSLLEAPAVFGIETCNYFLGYMQQHALSRGSRPKCDFKSCHNLLPVTKREDVTFTWLLIGVFIKPYSFKYASTVSIKFAHHTESSLSTVSPWWELNPKTSLLQRLLPTWCKWQHFRRRFPIFPAPVAAIPTAMTGRL